MGHYSSQCPKKNNNNNNNSNANIESGNNSNVQVQLSNVNEEICNFTENDKLRNWLLLDNQSTADIFCNRNYLSNIHPTNEQMTVYTNGGSLPTLQKGTL